MYGWLEGGGRKILVEPEALLTEASRARLDGQKMSKSYGNTIALREEPEVGGEEDQDHAHRPGAGEAQHGRNPEKCRSGLQDLLDAERKEWVVKAAPRRASAAWSASSR